MMARLSGVNVDRIKVATYDIRFHGWAVLICSTPPTLPLVCPDGAVDYEASHHTQQLSAEPVSLRRRQGVPTPLCNVIVGMVKNILNLMGISPFVQPVAVDILIILAVAARTRTTLRNAEERTH